MQYEELWRSLLARSATLHGGTLARPYSSHEVFAHDPRHTLSDADVVQTNAWGEAWMERGMPIGTSPAEIELFTGGLFRQITMAIHADGAIRIGDLVERVGHLADAPGVRAHLARLLKWGVLEFT